MSNVASLPDKTKSVTVYMAERYGMEPAALEATLRATVIKPDRNGRVPSREEFAAFLLVAKQYNLDPITKEIFAFTDRGGVVPIVSVDGWSKLINSHPQFDGVTFDDQTDDKGNLVAITCNMHRKDRSHPTSVTEYMAECRRDSDTWKRWPRRMLRHKAMIQAARYAFGFAGIYDEDEGERIVDAHANREPPVPPTPPVPNVTRLEPPAPPVPPVPAAPPAPPEDMTVSVSPVELYKTALANATNAESVEAIWNDLIEPQMAAGAISRDDYEAIKALENEALARFQQ